MEPPAPSPRPGDPLCPRTQTHTDTQTHVHGDARTPRPRPPAYLPAPAGQARVPSDPAAEVVLALAVPAQVDGAGLHVDVHQVVHDAALHVVLHSVHQEAPAHVDHLDQGQVSAREDSCRSELRPALQSKAPPPERGPAPGARPRPRSKAPPQEPSAGPAPWEGGPHLCALTLGVECGRVGERLLPPRSRGEKSRRLQTK